MRYTVEALDVFRHRLAISFDADEVDAAFARTYAQCAYRYAFEGYAAGQAPREVIDTAFGNQAIEHLTGKTLREESLGRAIGEADLVAIGEPTYIDPTLPQPGQAYSFTAELDCSPLFELSSYEPITIRLPKLDSLNPTLARSAQHMRENEALFQLQQRLQGEPPEIMCDAQEEELMQAMYAQAHAANLPFESYLVQQRIDPTHFRKEIEEQALDAVRRNLALDAWAAHKGFSASDEEISQGFAASGLDYPAYEEAEWRATGRISQVRQNIRRGAAMKDIMQTLVVEEIE